MDLADGSISFRYGNTTRFRRPSKRSTKPRDHPVFPLISTVLQEIATQGSKAIRNSAEGSDSPSSFAGQYPPSSLKLDPSDS